MAERRPMVFPSKGSLIPKVLQNREGETVGSFSYDPWILPLRNIKQLSPAELEIINVIRRNDGGDSDESAIKRFAVLHAEDFFSFLNPDYNSATLIYVRKRIITINRVAHFKAEAQTHLYIALPLLTCRSVQDVYNEEEATDKITEADKDRIRGILRETYGFSSEEARLGTDVVHPSESQMLIMRDAIKDETWNTYFADRMSRIIDWIRAEIVAQQLLTEAPRWPAPEAELEHTKRRRVRVPSPETDGLSGDGFKTPPKNDPETAESRDRPPPESDKKVKGGYSFRKMFGSAKKGKLPQPSARELGGRSNE